MVAGLCRSPHPRQDPAGTGINPSATGKETVKCVVGYAEHLLNDDILGPAEIFKVTYGKRMDIGSIIPLMRYGLALRHAAGHPEIEAVRQLAERFEKADNTTIIEMDPLDHYSIDN